MSSYHPATNPGGLASNQTLRHPRTMPEPGPLSLIFTPANLATALIALNFLAFAAFGIDKWQAETGRWRTSEATLLLLALLGGTPGAYAGRRLFRHKTRKQPFVSQLHATALFQLVAGGAALGWWLGG